MDLPTRGLKNWNQNFKSRNQVERNHIKFLITESSHESPRIDMHQYLCLLDLGWMCVKEPLICVKESWIYYV